ncbi:MAG: hypothetical protein KC636_23090 [Myxococcales bacterium]|nr:hypothetical protein [Myxococcales bacterium]
MIFSIALAAGAVPLAGCVRLSVESDPFAGDVGLPAEVQNCTGCTHDDQPLRGELIAFVNARLSNPAANHTANFPIAAEDCEGAADSCYIGPAIYLYDPDLECDDAPGCRVARLGNLWLDERLGAISVADQSLKRFTLRDLAWHPQLGFWSIAYDSLNDEWGFGRLDVPSWTLADNHIGVDRYAVRAGPQAPETDPCYWRYNLTGLGFVGDRLYAGSAGQGGEIYELDANFVAAPAYAVHPQDSSQDPNFYAAGDVCRKLAAFTDSRGVAGDLVDDPAGDGLLAMIDARAFDSELDPGRNALYRVDVDDGRLTADGPYFADIVAGEHIDSLARVEGVLYGLNTRGAVFVIEEGERWRVTPHDDLGALFDDPDFDLLIRGATRVVVE